VAETCKRKPSIAWVNAQTEPSGEPERSESDLESLPFRSERHHLRLGETGDLHLSQPPTQGGHNGLVQVGSKRTSRCRDSALTDTQFRAFITIIGEVKLLRSGGVFKNRTAPQEQSLGRASSGRGRTVEKWSADRIWRRSHCCLKY